MTLLNMQGDTIQEKQAFPAIFTANWSSDEVHCCVKHAEAIHKLGAILGTHVALKNSPIGAQCGNCINESAKEQSNRENDEKN